MGTYEDTLEDMEKTLGSVPEFMRFISEESIVNDWPSWKEVGEIDLERARYLLSTDEILSEWLGKAHTGSMNAEFSRKARTVCCRMLVDTDKAQMAVTKTGEQFLVCNDNCRRFIETATPEQIKEISG